jgi:lia operon protein LiaF
MRNQGMLLIGVVLIAAGVLFLVSSLFDINIGAWCWPIGLILLGIFLFLRPRMLAAGTGSSAVFIGDTDRAGQWTVRPEEMWYFIADTDLDFTKADVPPGETILRLIGFIGEVNLTVPVDVGLTVRSSAFVTSLKEAGLPEEDTVFGTADWQSPDFKATERRVGVEITSFISEIKIRVV